MLKTHPKSNTMDTENSFMVHNNRSILGNAYDLHVKE